MVMSKNAKRKLARRVMILAVVLGSSIAFYFGLALTLGLDQPLMLVASNSMEPAISLGDMIAIKSSETSQIHLGDVIVYEKSLSRLSILHRVVCIVTSGGSSCTPPFYAYADCFVPPCYYTKGDNNPAPDPWVVLSSEIHGVWTGFRVPYIGMSLICLQQGPTCGSPWAVVSIVALGSTIAFDVGFEYWLSKRSQKNRLIVSGQSKREIGRS